MRNGSTTWTYTYDANGMRIGRTNGTKTYSYLYTNGLLSRMIIGDDTLCFAYDAVGAPLTVNYNGTTFYYVTNLQGDVIAILDSYGNAVAEYTYNAWGELLTTVGSTTTDLSTINPLLYRGYVYDRETGLYYLQSRYYNPEIGRFINADDLAYLGADGSILSYNLFAYCANNPVLNSDTTGTFVNTITGAIVGGIIGAVNALARGDNVLAGAAIGAATGALAGLTADIAIATGGIGAIAIAAIGGAVSSGLNYTATELVNGRDINPGKLAVEMTVGAIANLVTFGAGGGSMIKKSGTILSNMSNKFSTDMMKGTTKVVAGKVVPRAAKIARNIVAKNFLWATGETATIAFGAWVNANAWGMLFE